MALAQNTVIIRNIYYMMAYAFKTLDIDDYRHLASEPFDNMIDLLAAILVIGMSTQRRRGYERDYEAHHENLQRIVGRVDMRGTMLLRAHQRQGVRCEYDERTENTYKNRILVTAAQRLLASNEVSIERRRLLKQMTTELHSISSLSPTHIAWERLRYHRNNRSYQLLMNVCYLVLHDLLPRNTNGELRLTHMLPQESLSTLYEKFILEYFRRHHPSLHAKAQEIPRHASDDAPSFLPRMLTDVTLTRGSNRFIIDAKCYGTILGTHFGKEVLSPSNINQILSYVLHAQQEANGTVVGMLLYAKTHDEQDLREHWIDLGHDFYCYTLDLDNDFEEIADQLDEIAQLIS